MQQSSNPNLHNLFTGNFYIHEAYGIALAPTLLQAFSGVAFVEKTIDQLTAGVLSRNDSGSETTSTDKKFVAVVSFKQPVIKFSDYWMGWLGTQSYMKILENLKNDDSIAGVVMDTDSGGGQVYGTPEFYEYIISFCAIKPLVVYTGGLLCSGAYYFAAAASWIVAHNRADAIGSIGVYTVMVNWEGLYEKYGAKMMTIYSSLSEEKNKAHRNVMSGKDKDFKEYIKKELDPIAEQFIADMKAVRPQIKEEAFKGGTWTGAQSVEIGLADENGSLETAIAKVYELADQKENEQKNLNNSNKSNMSKTKSFPHIQRVAGIDGEGLKIQAKGVLSSKEGAFISEEEADAIEAEISGHAAAIEAEREKVTVAEGKITKAKGKVTKMETAIDAAIKEAGLEAEVVAGATTSDKITLLGAKVIEFSGKPRTKGAKPKANGDGFETEADSVVNEEDEHNKMYNSL